MNKIDLIEEELLEFKMNQIISFVKKMNSYAELIQSKNCLISIQALLNRDKQDISKIDNLSISKNDQHKYQHGKGEISQISLENTGDYNPELFQLFLNALFITYRNRLFRIKAVLSFPDNNRRILLQGVYDQLQFEQGSIKEKDHINKFVFSCI